MRRLAHAEVLPDVLVKILLLAILPRGEYPNPRREKVAEARRFASAVADGKTVRYLDLDGKPQELAAKGLLATAIQHEIDHLNGKLIIDFLSRLKRDIIVRRFKKQAKADATA